MTDQQLQVLVEELSLRYFKRAFIHRAYFNRRLKTTGGRYLLMSHDIEINEKMLTEHDQATLIGTIKHELCHYHLHLTGQGYRHRDQDFKQLLRQVGGLRYAPASSKNYRYTYGCQNCGQKYQRQRRIDVKRFVCSRCHGKLRLLKKI